MVAVIPSLLDFCQELWSIRRERYKKTWGEANVISGDKKEEPREFKEKPASLGNMET